MTAFYAQTDSDFKTYSKFDLTPGEEVLFYDNFASGAAGDLPASWNTNGTVKFLKVTN